MKTKYAMIPINRRYENGVRIVRRVLISYIKKFNNEYIGTKLIEKDPYFKDPKSSHQYEFKDNCFRLIKDDYGGNYLLNKFRPYVRSRLEFIDDAIEFKAKSDKEAISIFNSRGGI